MESRARPLNLGFAWGLIQGNLLLVIVSLLATREMNVADYTPAWEAALLSEILMSFVAGAILGDYYDVVKAVLLSLVVALAFSMPLIPVLGISLSVSPEQGYAEAVFFGLLTPIQLFLGTLFGIAGSAFNEFFSLRNPITLTRRARKIALILLVIIVGVSGFYEWNVVASPNFSVSAPPSLLVNSSCSPQPYNRTQCPIITIPFVVRVNPVRGYLGTVTIINLDHVSVSFFNSSSYFSCSPSPLRLPAEASASCQFTHSVWSGASWVSHNRVTDNNIIHDFYVQVKVG